MLGRKSLLILLSNVAGGVLGVLTIYVIGHRMGPEPLGRFTYAWALVLMVRVLGDLGTTQAHVKLASESAVDPARALGAFITVRLALAGIVVAGVGSLFALARWAPHLFAWGPEPPIALLGLLVATLLLWLIRSVPIATWTARRETSRQELPMLVEHVTRFAAILGAVAVYRSWARLPDLEPGRLHDRGAVLLAGASLLAVGASTVVALAMFARSGHPAARPNRDQVATYVRFAAPLALAGALAVLVDQVDRVLVGGFWGPAAVGLYHGAARLHAFLLVVAGAAFTLLVPRFSELLSAGDRGAAAILLAETSRRLSMVVLPLVALTLVLAEEILVALLGARFAGSAAVLRWLMPYALAMSATSAQAAYVLGAGRSGLAARISIGSALTVVVLDLLLVPDAIGGVRLAGLGSAGAAIGTSLSGLVAAALYERGALSSGAPRRDWPAFAAQAAAAAAMAALVFAWKVSPLAVPFDRPWALALAGATGLAFYAGMLVLLRALQPADLRFFRDLADARAMARHVRGELSSSGPSATTTDRRGSEL